MAAGVFEHERVGVRQLRPEDEPDAERVALGLLHHALDESVVVADLRIRLIRLKDAENPREAPHHVPVENRILGLRIGGVIEQDDLLPVQLGQQTADLVVRVGEIQIPRSQQQPAARVILLDVAADAAVNVLFQPQVGLAVVGIGAFGQPDGVEQSGLPVFADMRGGEREIVVQIRVVGDVPDQPVCSL